MKSLFVDITLLLLIAININFTGCSSMKNNGRVTKLPDDKNAYFNHPEIIQNSNKEGDFILRNKNKDVEKAADIKDVVEKMRRILIESKGMGLAAPQVGENIKVALIMRMDKENKPVEVYTNPEIKWVSEETEIDYEGCLSVREGIGKVARSKKVKVKYQTINDQVMVEEISGLTARIFQHEVDHLAGILFVDKRTGDPLITLEEYLKIKEKRKAAEKNSVQ